MSKINLSISLGQEGAEHAERRLAYLNSVAKKYDLYHGAKRSLGKALLRILDLAMRAEEQADNDE